MESPETSSDQLGVAAHELPAGGRTRERPGFGRGIVVGFAGTLVLIQVWLATQLLAMREIFANFEAERVPMISRISVSPVWLWGVPALGGIATALLIVRRPRASWPYVALAFAMAVTVAVTWYGSQQPFRQRTDTVEF